MNAYSIRLEPIDPLLFGDNRMARAGEDHVLSAQGPSPYTLFGAIGNFLTSKFSLKNVRDWEKNKKVTTTLGDFISEDFYTGNNSYQIMGYTFIDSSGKLWFPNPKNFVIKELKQSKTISHYYPHDLLIPSDPKGLSSVAFKKVLESKPFKDEVEDDFFVNEGIFQKLLVNDFPTDRLDIRFKDDLYLEESRMGLAMCNKMNVTKVGHLFNRPYWRFKSGIVEQKGFWNSSGLKVWIDLLSPADEIEKFNDIGFLGGDRRRAYFRFEQLSRKPLEHLKNEVLSNLGSTTGFYAYLFTPLPVYQDLTNYKVSDYSPIAAASGKPVYMSGWFNDRGNQHPRALLHLAPSGSILYYEWKTDDDTDKRKRIIEDYWLTSLSPQYANFGFGRILLGVWK